MTRPSRCRSPFPFAACALLSASLGGCATLLPSRPKSLTFDVAAHTVACVKRTTQRCLMTRQLPGGEWQQLPEPVEGFRHETGYRYRIEVTRRRADEPTPGGTRYEYRLVRVLSRERSR